MLRESLKYSKKVIQSSRTCKNFTGLCTQSQISDFSNFCGIQESDGFKGENVKRNQLLRFFGENQGPQKHQFKAETKRLLDIVAKSLYTDSEVFIRELLSNCSDALEKQRYLQISGASDSSGDPLQISITTDDAKRQLIIQDTGIGMTKEELIENLGTIANSGSKKFVEEVKNLGDGQSYDPESIIGQFGVGFYSVFIVGHTVEVVTRREGQEALKWVSDGSGEYSIENVEDDLRRGTRIKIFLNPEHKNFSKRAEVAKIVSKFSNFISHPIFLDGERTNKLTALWAKSKNDIEENDYQEFWEHISKSKIPFKYLLHYTAEMPLQVKSILYFPNSHSERSGMQQEKLQVSLYSRKILIKENCSDLFPEYLRFLKGVVDCEDLPLNISRENYQDSHLIGRLRGLLTKRVLKHLVDKSKTDPSGYGNWYREFSNFIRQGALSDSENKATLINLMRFNSTLGQSITLQQYIEAMKEGQKNIYFMQSLNMEHAKTNPFFEPFLDSEVPVLFLSESIDEMILTDQGKYKNFQMINIESDFEAVRKDLNLPPTKSENSIPENEISSFCLWIKNELSPKVTQVKISQRLKSAPAIIVSPLTSGMRQMAAMMDPSQIQNLATNLTFEINPSHELMIKLNKIRRTDMPFAKSILRQVMDNCLLTSGLLFEFKDFVERINSLLVRSLTESASEPGKLEINSGGYREEISEKKDLSKNGEKPGSIDNTTTPKSATQQHSGDSILEQTMRDMMNSEKKRQSKTRKADDLKFGSDGKPII